MDLDPDNGELILTVNTALQGEWSGFNRFSYQVVATLVRIGSFIEGMVVWPTGLSRPPSNDPSVLGPLLGVAANHWEEVPVAGNFLPMEKLTPITPGVFHSLHFDDQNCSARYRIDNPPMGMPLQVVVSVADGFAPGTTVTANRVHGPKVFKLAPTLPSVEVDFRLSREDVR